jgi:hypothetical protein
MSATINTNWGDVLAPGAAKDFFTRRPAGGFDPTATTYKLDNALWLLELSRLVYRHDDEETPHPPLPTRKSFLALHHFEQLAFFLNRRTGARGYLVLCHEPVRFAALVFRGTEGFLDVIENLRTISEPLPGGGTARVHTGFEDQYLSVRADVERALEHVSDPLFITGHSLGAALATLAAAGRKVQGVYTFGSPRVGNQAFVDSLKGTNIFRVVDDQDVVPTLPPEGLGFVHAGELHHLTETPPVSQKIFGPPKLLADHAPVNYIDRLL